MLRVSLCRRWQYLFALLSSYVLLACRFYHFIAIPAACIGASPLLFTRRHLPPL